MNLAGLSVAVGLITVGIITLPWGLVIFVALALLGWWSRPH